MSAAAAPFAWLRLWVRSLRALALQRPLTLILAIGLPAFLLIGVFLRLQLAWGDDGIYWPDEIYQSLEPAHYLAYGYGLLPWEFIQGVRSWAFPALLAGVMRLCDALGLQAPEGYLTTIRLLFCVASFFSLWGCYRLARVCGAGRLTALTAAAAFALSTLAIYFTPRAMSEMAVAPMIVWGLALALSTPGTRTQHLAGAALLGLSVWLRLQSGYFCFVLLALLLLRRRWRQALEALAILALCAFLFGLLDALTWGHWFGSAIGYLQFNLVNREKAAMMFGVEPWDYYLHALISSNGFAVSMALLLLLIASARRQRALLLLALGFVALHSWLPHKELRFLLPALPLLYALGAVGLEVLGAMTLESLGTRCCAIQRPALCAAALCCAMVSLSGYSHLTFGDLGHITQPAGQSAFDANGAVNRLLNIAAHQRDMGGIKVEVTNHYWLGGYAYFHRRAPIYADFGPARYSALYNYIITPRLYAEGDIIAEDHGLVLARIHREKTMPDPTYLWRLPWGS